MPQYRKSQCKVEECFKDGNAVWLFPFPVISEGMPLGLSLSSFFLLYIFSGQSCTFALLSAFDPRPPKPECLVEPSLRSVAHSSACRRRRQAPGGAGKGRQSPSQGDCRLSWRAYAVYAWCRTARKPSSKNQGFRTSTSSPRVLCDHIWDRA